MKTVVRVPFAIVLLLTAAAATAQPAKDDSKAAIAAQQEPAKVVLASADGVRPPAPTAQRNPAPAKRPAPRVTTCRCGDPQPDQDQQPDE
jgi:hypothetical protein